MVLVKPSSYRAARTFTFQGVEYPKGAPISNVLIVKIPHLNALINRRFIEPVPDPYRRKGPWRHQASDISKKFFNSGALRDADEEQSEVESQSSEATPPAVSEDSHDEIHEHADYPHDGTIADVKAWVGDDVDRALYAMQEEENRPTPRVTLLDYLNTIGAN